MPTPHGRPERVPSERRGAVWLVVVARSALHNSSEEASIDRLWRSMKIFARCPLQRAWSETSLDGEYSCIYSCVSSGAPARSFPSFSAVTAPLCVVSERVQLECAAAAHRLVCAGRSAKCRLNTTWTKATSLEYAIIPPASSTSQRLSTETFTDDCQSAGHSSRAIALIRRHHKACGRRRARH